MKLPKIASKKRVDESCPHFDKNLDIKPKLIFSALQGYICDIHGENSQCKNIWLCTRCDQTHCGGNKGRIKPPGNAARHAKETGHFLVMQPDSDKGLWCLSCKKYIRVDQSLKNGESDENQSDKKNQKKKGLQAHKGSSMKIPKMTELKKKIILKRRDKSCPHFDKDLDIKPQLLFDLLKEYKCEIHNEKSECKNLWFCTRCDQSHCGGNTGPIKPPGHAVRHAVESKHSLVMQSGSRRDLWCLLCEKYIRVNLPVKKRKTVKKGGVSKTHRKRIKDYRRSILKSILGKSRQVTNEPCRYRVRGMANQGATCYFSAVMQNILSLELLRNHYVDRDFVRDSFPDLMKELYFETGPNSRREVLNVEIYALLFAIRAKCPGQFVHDKHHDSQELLLQLLNNLIAEEKEQCASFIEPTFQVETITRMSCYGCGHESEERVTDFTLGLAIPCKKMFPKWKKFRNASERIGKKKTGFERGETSGKDRDDDVATVNGSGSADVSKVNTKVDDVASVKESESADVSGFNTKVDGVAGVKESGSADVSGFDTKVDDVVAVKDSGSADVSAFDTKVDDVAGVKESGSADASGVDTIVDDVAAVKESGSADVSGFDTIVDDVAAVNESGSADESGVDTKVDDESEVDTKVAEAMRKLKGKAIATDPEDNDKSDDERRFKVDSSYLLQTKSALSKPYFAQDTLEGRSDLADQLKAMATVIAAKEKATAEDKSDDERRFKVDSSYLLNTKSTLSKPYFAQDTLEGRSDLADQLKAMAMVIAAKEKATAEDPSTSSTSENEPKGRRKIFKRLYPEKISKLFRQAVSSYLPHPDDYEVDNSKGKVSIKRLLDGMMGSKETPEDKPCKKCRFRYGASFFEVSCNGAPLILVLHLLRFHCEGGVTHKIHGHVKFKERLVFGQYMRAKYQPQDVVYRLMGIVEHKGTLGWGHYIAFVRGGCPEDDWFRVDDANITLATLEDVLERDAYLLFYQRIDRNAADYVEN